jgi:hypothetical protein
MIYVSHDCNDRCSQSKLVLALFHIYELNLSVKFHAHQLNRFVCQDLELVYNYVIRRFFDDP